MGLDEIQYNIGEHTELHIEEAQSELEELFLALGLLIIAEMRKIYDKHSEDGKLTYSEMRKYKRLDSLIKQINGYLNDFYKKVYKNMDKDIITEYKYNFEAYRDMLEEHFEMDSKIETPKNDEIRDMFLIMLAGLTTKEILNKNKSDLVYTLKNQISSGLNERSNYNQMVNKIKSSLDNSFRKLKQMEDWQIRKVQTKATLDINKEIADKGTLKVYKKWVTARDNRVRVAHQKMEGKEIEVSKQFTMPDGSKSDGPRLCNNNIYNYNCRCKLVYDYKKNNTK